jgi:hypothetical protein
MTADRPRCRSAQVITHQHGDAEIASQEPERIRLALVDGSRCLPGEWALRYVAVMATHEDSGVRWGAMFALDMVRADWMQLDAESFFDLKHLVQSLSCEDPDPAVRHMAAQVLGDVIADLLPRGTEAAS